MAETAMSFDDQQIALTADMMNGLTLKQVRGITDREMEALYAHGYALYNQGKYGEAAKAFCFLVQHDQLEKRWYKAFGSSLQMLKQHESALKYYGVASTLDMMDPEPSFHAAECLLAIGKLDEAKSALEACVVQCAASAPHKAMGERAKALLAVFAQSKAA